MEIWLHVQRDVQRYLHSSELNLGDLKLELCLQFGYGMMDHCRFLIKEWAGGTVILSPRDLSHSQLERLGKEIKALGGQVLLDPQIYNPIETNHVRLVAQEYWPTTGTFPSDEELTKCIASLITLNRTIGAHRFILPGMLATNIDDDWLAIQQQVIEEVERSDLDGMSPMLTVALSYDAVRNDAQVHRLLDAIQSWDVPSIYLVFEHPDGEYLVSDANWLANCADIVAGVRLSGREAIIGYCNHQMLALAAAAPTAIASGTWMNVRSFNASKFTLAEDDEIKQRSTWYYAPQLLSEYKVTFMDLANKTGSLDLLKTPDEYHSHFADDLFSAPQPSLATFTEQQAFRHYLQCLSVQTKMAVRASFDETLGLLLASLDTAEMNLGTLHSKGVKGQKRDFLDYIDINRGALKSFEINRGAMLRRKWNILI